jgi:hypothetical protein
MKLFTCSICGVNQYGWDNNAAPVNDGRCCGDCNTYVVIPLRMARIKRGMPVYEAPKPKEE